MPVHDWTRVIAGAFHHFHHEWISTISKSLNSGVLPDDCYAMAEQIAGGFGPDVLTLSTALTTALATGQEHVAGFFDGDAVGGSTVLVTSQPQVRFSSRLDGEAWSPKSSRIAIRHRSGDGVIAMIEIVSPGNKSSRYAMKRFVDKSLELLESGVHLLLIDLFPPGPRDPNGIHAAIWSEMQPEAPFELPADEPLTLVAYAAGDGIEAFIEPVAVGKVLPDMPLFLTHWGHVSVPLEATYRAAFDAVPRRWQAELVI